MGCCVFHSEVLIAGHGDLFVNLLPTSVLCILIFVAKCTVVVDLSPRKSSLASRSEQYGQLEYRIEVWRG